MPWEPNNVEQDRLDKLNALIERGVNPFPNRVERTHTAQEAIALFEAHEDEYEAAAEAGTEREQVTVCGRIVRQNLKGKIYFAHIEDGSGRVQLFVRINAVGEETFEQIKLFDMGDFVQASGPMMRTRAGEVSVEVQDLKLLAKALSPLPVIKERKLEDGTVQRYGEFSDVEERYRQRYADLAVNPKVREVFQVRARTIRAMQSFLDEQGFLEVETPILQPVYGGAAARPFTTHHNQLHQDLYLRISFELYLKRLLVGGFDGVYEIGRDFRNEGVSFKHNTEFTQLELYQAYTDYKGMMDITEALLRHVAEQVTGSTQVVFGEHVLDFGSPWRRVTVNDLIQEFTGIDYRAYEDATALEAAMRDKGLEFAPNQPFGKLIEVLLDQAEPYLIQPTFVMDYPRDISPFAKKLPGDPTHVERFEFFIAGMEMGNAFTELNNPLDQEERFYEMAKIFRDEDEDATPVDEDYLRAMRYGMPPCGGVGMGVDRFVMLLTNRPNIREVLLFPHLRARDSGTEQA
jgi:lysyl-tRNA synthetase class 2